MRGVALPEPLGVGVGVGIRRGGDAGGGFGGGGEGGEGEAGVGEDEERFVAGVGGEVDVRDGGVVELGGGGEGGDEDGC